ncbi:MAG: hypothetical protein R3202_14470, partial [Candidatus Competibacterales bacterium]|nr:hypothetical protein [Candidatus Competibacterales bacterium]
VIDTMLAEQRLDLVPVKVRGGFTADGRTTPAATRLEVLLAALTFLPPGPRRQRVERALRAGLEFLLAAQFTTGPRAGAVPRYAVPALSDHPRAWEIRIDYVQHFLSALQQARALGLDPAAPGRSGASAVG